MAKHVLVVQDNIDMTSRATALPASKYCGISRLGQHTRACKLFATVLPSNAGLLAKNDLLVPEARSGEKHGYPRKICKDARSYAHPTNFTEQRLALWSNTRLGRSK